MVLLQGCSTTLCAYIKLICNLLYLAWYLSFCAGDHLCQVCPKVHCIIATVEWSELPSYLYSSINATRREVCNVLVFLKVFLSVPRSVSRNHSACKWRVCKAFLELLTCLWGNFEQAGVCLWSLVVSYKLSLLVYFTHSLSSPSYPIKTDCWKHWSSFSMSCGLEPVCTSLPHRCPFSEDGVSRYLWI